MNDSIMGNWKTGKVTASNFVKFMLSLACGIGSGTLFRFIYGRFTVEGREWMKMKDYRQLAGRSIQAIIDAVPELTELSERMAAVVPDLPLKLSWWTLFDVTGPGQIVGIYTYFLRDASDDELKRFAVACNDLLDYIIKNSRVKEGILVSTIDNETMRTMAAQYLAGAFSHMGDEKDIRKSLLAAL